MIKLNPTHKGWLLVHERMQPPNHFSAEEYLWRYRDSDEQYHYFIHRYTKEEGKVEVEVGDFDIDWDIYNGLKPRPTRFTEEDEL